ncbi:MAG: enoyl-CoA hydratase/isomerase family protein [Beutenbergiaceae bacterium]
MRDGLQTWVDDDVAHILLNQPERLNPLGPDQWAGIDSFVRDVETMPGIRAIVVGSQGRFFCAGNDLRVVGGLRSAQQAREYFLGVQLPTLVRLASSPLPIVCAVQADSAGGGLELALYCDVVIAATQAHFFLPEGQVGLFATTVVAPAVQTIGRQFLQRLAFTGERFSATQALDAGLVHQVRPREQLAEAVEEVVAQIRRSSPASVAATKAALNAGLLHEGLPLVEAALAHLSDSLLLSPDGQEGLNAYREKREARWSVAPARDYERFVPHQPSQGES